MDRVAAVILLRPDGAALLQHRDDKPGLRHPGMWVPPGGHAEPGEAMVDCARRELREETEYRLDEPIFLMEVLDQAPGFPTNELAIFWAWYDGVQPIVCHEGQALEFIGRSKAGALAIPPVLLAAWDTALARAGLGPGPSRT
ncbi:MAG: NUDIX domain-containing protein [Burkholderiales bacterium]|nr:NUDIX domain-containing protein [Burkholderiales bacterium]